MRKVHDTWVYDDTGQKVQLQTGYEPEIWQCERCGHPNARSDDWPTCVYCGRFRDEDVEVVYDWGG